MSQAVMITLIIAGSVLGIGGLLILIGRLTDPGNKNAAGISMVLFGVLGIIIGAVGFLVALILWLAKV